MINNSGYSTPHHSAPYNSGQPGVVPSNLLPYHRPTFTDAQLLQVYLVAAIIANFLCLFFNGYGGDLGYWFNWIGQLTTQGYRMLHVDYPPLYIHWIYAVGKLMPALGVSVENNVLLKMLLEFPALLCHLAIILMVNHTLDKIGTTRAQRHCVLLLTALNPAILFNGPVWGQVDIIPVTFALAALMLHFSPRFGIWSIPFYMLGILTKFQMICFAPVMGILFFRSFRKSLIGIVLSVFVGFFAFIPFILNGEFIQFFKQAYVATLGQYAYTTFNAANIWMLITANTTPDNTILFTLGKGTPYAHEISAKLFGMGLFSLVCLLIFIQGVRAQLAKKLGSPTAQLSQILFYAMLCALAFFTLLPAMHERYLFPAVCMAVVYTATNPQRMIYGLLVTLVCFVNMILINGINGSDIWFGLSSMVVLVFIFAIIDLFTGKYFYLFLHDVTRFLTGFRWLAFWALIICTGIMLHVLVKHFKQLDVELASNQRLLTTITPVSSEQGYGTLQIDRSVEGNILSIGNQRYLHGLGTHTPAKTVYNLPPGAIRFSFIVGVDDEVGTANMQFSVWGDGKQLWQSDILYGFETDNTEVSVDIKDVHELQLRIDPVTDNQFDHADWIDPVITFDHDLSKQLQ